MYNNNTSPGLAKKPINPRKSPLFSSPHISREDGFTLLELIIVIALIGIISGIAAPQVSGVIPGYRVKSASQQIVSEMMLLKMRAINENRRHRIVFGSPDKSHYKIQQDGNKDGDYSDSVDTVIKTEALPTGVVFDTNASKRTSGDPMCSDAICFGPDNAVDFTPTGTSDSGSVYFMPQEDKASGRADRMIAISTTIVARVKVWRYSGGKAEWVR